MDCFLEQQNNHGIMGEKEEDDLDSISSSSSSLSFTSDSIVSSSSDLIEEATSSSSSSSSDQLSSGPLFEMASLMQQLPFKRGLSKHFQGKSQSFTSLSNVRCLEDLVKVENPYNKKLKSCKSYGGLLLESHKASSPPMRTTNTKTISKKSSKRGAIYSMGAKKSNGLLCNKPPAPSQRSNSTSSFCNHNTPMFA
ncbi:hypothetical protein GIB67_006296 [Kingdonia uniflora]|uniref:Oxidative stress 3 n=1 Tax=Kingdonia uniflora TaxID=39325 RepID=A0A7J7P690_9MAGN|nr:hypothetical protein GIB67_006296 [Kingdonia uniflora]